MARLEILVLSGSTIAALTACTPSLPGESLGTFELAMKLEQNTCGESAVYTTDGAHLSVELRSEDKACYWRVPGQPVMEGSLEGDKCHFTVTNVVASDAPDPVATDPGLIVPDPTKAPVDMSTKPVCQLLQTAEIVTTITAASPADGGVESDAGRASADGGVGAVGLVLEASYDLTIVPSSSQDCAAALIPAGPFKALPCSVSYSLRGGERESFD
jgi:hypothetical protein